MDATIFLNMAAMWKATIVARTEVLTFSGGAISEKYLANLDSQGLGPEGRFRIGRKVVYPTDKFVKWLESRSASIPKK